MANLTIKDPIDPKVLANLRELTARRDDIANELLSLELRRVQLLVSAREVSNEKSAIFTHVFAERDLDPNAVVSVDDETGVITLCPK